ncbi:MAG: hypothetical protein A3D31_00980 [Candidatus Fluviicola riflensis]|nr:MAG: hypothetical protein CHH17_04560 [Candidatus Fluviicola riflensis]OGS76179.1 MAG: hypothetical protein A3D31_00980 [Candidatus Fluviicola riflensis]OGS83277.1 MAG: hypothetical protein A2724_00860 [Fluviicola sp. RIFCSPHIGHO2_01_FULL_43_53]OGS83711.1 MAG: hypothetical protein A3E30_17585 [Fluviicola sp. RIFCSPHIGHO2_12_FULL_43_24]
MKALFTFFTLAIITSGYAQNPREGLPVPTTGRTNIPFPSVRIPTVFNPTSEAKAPDFNQLIATGDYYFNQKRYSDAIDNYTKALDQRADQHAKDQILRAEALQAREEKEKALRTEEERKAEATRIPQAEFISRTLTDNPWRNAAFVCDVTGSMDKYNDQTLAWLKPRIEAGDSSIQGVVLFNDNEDHEINMLRGTHSFVPTTYEEATQRFRDARKESHGYDVNENNIQGLLRAQQDYPSCENLIMINDNNEPWDFSLASQVTKPVHVIICGPPAALEAAFLNLARMTKGSVHFNGRSYKDLDTYTEGTTLKVNNTTYVVRDGKFVRTN